MACPNVPVLNGRSDYCAMTCSNSSSSKGAKSVIEINLLEVSFQVKKINTIKLLEEVLCIMKRKFPKG